MTPAAINSFSFTKRAASLFPVQIEEHSKTSALTLLAVPLTKLNRHILDFPLSAALQEY
jgi:hypothetical protein